MNKWLLTGAILAATWAAPAPADSTAAHCEIYPRGADRPGRLLACTFSQRQGALTIRRSDGVIHDLAPVGDTPGSYRDQDGHPAWRQSGLGEQGLIFRFEQETVYVYWDTTALYPQADPANPTAPFTTVDYAATTLLRCRAAGSQRAGRCPAGILRMAGNQASIAVMSPAGERFTMNFMKDRVNAGNRQVKAMLKGDTWIVTVSDGDVYEVPLAAISGD